MTAQDVREWLKSVISKAANDNFGQQPEKVILTHATVTNTLPWRTMGIVKVAGRNYHVSLDITHQGDYSNFQTTEI